MGSFEWNDKQSEDLLKTSGLEVKKTTDKILASGVKYTGEMSGSMRHGRGTYIAPDGGRYEGYFIQDKKEGYGRMIYGDGDVYIG